MNIIDVEGLRKVYGEVVAVDEITFSIASGEIFGFLGANGAGKTSTIYMLIGLSSPSSGSIIIDGIDCTRNIKKAQRIMGIVPDESNLYDEMNGYENLCFCGSLYGMKKQDRERRANELLCLFKLDFAGKRLFKTYSKGMRRKLCIAAGIMHYPKILFLDEPTTGIDVESARFIRNLILELKAQGTTVFITTHYIEDAQRICDRVAFIVGGRIVKTGTVSELMQNTDDEIVLKLRYRGEAAKSISEYNMLHNDRRIARVSENECLLYSNKHISLAEITDFFTKRDVEIFEATEMRPTLEDVFVKVTGIEADKLRKEKEGKK